MRALAAFLAVMSLIAAGLSAWASVALIWGPRTTEVHLFDVGYTLPWAPIAAVALVVLAGVLTWIALYREPAG